MSKLIQPHGCYRKLKTFQLARLTYDLTVRFCKRFVSPYSRTHDQMVQAARSGVQNIAEGSKASATSKKTEIKLTNVARASLEELLCDYEDYIRHHNLNLWDRNNPNRDNLIQQRFQTADEVSMWVKELHQKTQIPVQEIAANATLSLIAVTCVLLKRQIDAQAKSFEVYGGFTERMYNTRKQTRL
ncbi:MAG: four helix bundle suffix domain-containing protein [Chlamydiia bacterium]|nr:four helix bundle suffix domain-containing protein [Chlamydiia bacterium]